jgi:hypothetical protein
VHRRVEWCPTFGSWRVDEREIAADTLVRLITDAGLAANASAVGAEMAAMPAPERLVPRIEALVT